MNTTVWASIILGLSGIIITTGYYILSHRLADQQMEKQLFTEFNLRYAALNDCLNKIELEYPTM